MNKYNAHYNMLKYVYSLIFLTISLLNLIHASTLSDSMKSTMNINFESPESINQSKRALLNISTNNIFVAPLISAILVKSATKSIYEESVKKNIKNTATSKQTNYKTTLSPVKTTTVKHSTSRSNSGVTFTEKYLSSVTRIYSTDSSKYTIHNQKNPTTSRTTKTNLTEPQNIITSHEPLTKPTTSSGKPTRQNSDIKTKSVIASTKSKTTTSKTDTKENLKPSTSIKSHIVTPTKIKTTSTDSSTKIVSETINHKSIYTNGNTNKTSQTTSVAGTAKALTDTGSKTTSVYKTTRSRDTTSSKASATHKVTPVFIDKYVPTHSATDITCETESPETNKCTEQIDITTSSSKSYSTTETTFATERSSTAYSFPTIENSSTTESSSTTKSSSTIKSSSPTNNSSDNISTTSKNSENRGSSTVNRFFITDRISTTDINSTTNSSYTTGSSSTTSSSSTTDSSSDSFSKTTTSTLDSSRTGVPIGATKTDSLITSMVATAINTLSRNYSSSVSSTKTRRSTESSILTESPTSTEISTKNSTESLTPTKIFTSVKSTTLSDSSTFTKNIGHIPIETSIITTTGKTNSPSFNITTRPTISLTENPTLPSCFFPSSTTLSTHSTSNSTSVSSSFISRCNFAISVDPTPFIIKVSPTSIKSSKTAPTKINHSTVRTANNSSAILGYNTKFPTTYPTTTRINPSLSINSTVYYAGRTGVTIGYSTTEVTATTTVTTKTVTTTTETPTPYDGYSGSSYSDEDNDWKDDSDDFEYTTYKYQTLSWLTETFYYNTDTTETLATYSPITSENPTPTSTNQSNDSNDTNTITSKITTSSTEATDDGNNTDDTDDLDDSSNVTEDNTATVSKEESETLLESIGVSAQFITPNNYAIIPESSEVAYIKFNRVSYEVLIGDVIATATLVQELPVLLSRPLNVTADSVMVVSITKSTLIEKLPSVVATIAIPVGNLSKLQYIIQSNNTLLFSARSQIPSLIDKQYLINSRKALSNLYPVIDPNQENSKETSLDLLPKEAIIGICVGIGVSVYVAVTIAGIRYYRKRKVIKDRMIQQQHIIFADSISSPIMQSNSLGFDKNCK